MTITINGTQINHLQQTKKLHVRYQYREEKPKPTKINQNHPTRFSS